MDNLERQKVRKRENGEKDKQPHVNPTALQCQATCSPKAKHILYHLLQHVKTNVFSMCQKTGLHKTHD